VAGALVQTWTDEGVGHVRLACPERLNAIDMPLARELLAAVEAAGEDPAVRCLVLSGAGPAFSSGGDIGALAALPAADTLALTDTVLAVADALERPPVPSIAALHGATLGGGVSPPVGAWLGAPPDDARLGLPEVRLGLIPGSGGVARLPRLIGRGPATRLLLTGDAVAAGEALELGLVDVVAPASELLDVAVALARRIARNGPLAVGAIMGILREQDAPALRRGLAGTAQALEEMLASADAHEGLTAFVERRPPAFEGR
jgi:enoyl-CoA hydratase/carnithine racemase